MATYLVPYSHLSVSHILKSGKVTELVNHFSLPFLLYSTPHPHPTPKHRALGGESKLNSSPVLRMSVEAIMKQQCG